MALRASATHSRIACGGEPPRGLDAEGSQCVSAKAERQARVSFRWEPVQGYTTFALFSSFLFLLKRPRGDIYSGRPALYALHHYFYPLSEL